MESIKPEPLLAAVEYPRDLRALPETELHEFSQQLRRYIIEHCSIYGGHFGGSLGVVELTTALHYAFNTPEDLIVWDVGHQAYGHKLITGRRSRFHTNRKYGGLAGFPNREESEYDTFGVGHSSTSISAALGMSVAAQKTGQNRQVVAVIGDGALTGGMAFEGLNHAGSSGADLLVVLNDNCMSIDGNVGAMKEYLTDVTSSHTFNHLRDELWRILGRFKDAGNVARKYASKLEDAFMSAFFQPGRLFEALGFRYFGPVDGHDVNHLVRLLKDLQDIPGPKLLHCVTVKGKGFAPAEADQTKWHATSVKFDKITGEMFKPAPSPEPQPKKYQDVFGKSLIELARENEMIVAVTPAMLSGHGLLEMSRVLPEQCFDVGIAEQHAVTFSAGMATQGLTPFCCIYSTFMQRGYDQAIHDVVVQNLKVIFSLDRAGVVGADGATHQGAFDIAYMRCLPNMIVSAPMNESELRNLMFTATTDAVQGPMTIRYPRGKGVMIDWQTPFEAVEIGKGRQLRDGDALTVLSFGHPGNFAAKACEQLSEKYGIEAAHFDMRFAKPLDEQLLADVFARFDRVITVEDGCLQGGFGSAVLEFMAENDFTAKVKRLGLPDRIIHHGQQSELYRECGYDAQGILEAALEMTAARALV